MKQAHRVVEFQSRQFSHRATGAPERAESLDAAIEATKPPHAYRDWNPLIATQFRYAPTGREARFRPAYFRKNVLYASEFVETALFEHGYHYLKERMHVPRMRDTGQRTAFALFVSEADITDLRGDPNVAALTNRDDYGPSHAFVESVENAAVKALCYPSCRDPNRRPNYAVLEIASIANEIGEQLALSFAFDQPAGRLYWVETRTDVRWDAVR